MSGWKIEKDGEAYKVFWIFSGKPSLFFVAWSEKTAWDWIENTAESKGDFMMLVAE